MHKQPLSLSALKPLEAINLQETALRHAMAAERILEAECEPLSTIACTGAFILARTAYFAHRALTEIKPRKGEAKLPPYRQMAHKMLEEALDEIELMMTKTQGRC